MDFYSRKQAVVIVNNKYTSDYYCVTGCYIFPTKDKPPCFTACLDVFNYGAFLLSIISVLVSSK